MSENETFIVQSETPDRLFVKIYHDFLDSELLDRNEKMVFILLKRYLNFKDDLSGVQGHVYPSLDTLSKQCGMSKGAVIRTLKSLENKKVLTKERRGLNKPNLYTIRDFSGIWTSKNQSEVNEEVGKYELEKAKRIAEEYGYKLVKEKELDSAPAKVSETSTCNFNDYNEYISHFDKNNTTSKTNQSQGIERYSIAQIKEYFYYNNMINDNPYMKDDIDSVINILYDALNTTNETIRIGKENKASMVVISKLMALDCGNIIYTINKFKDIQDRIKHPTSYILTMLYKSKEQMNLDYANQVKHESYNLNEEDN